MRGNKVAPWGVSRRLLPKWFRLLAVHIAILVGYGCVFPVVAYLMWPEVSVLVALFRIAQYNRDERCNIAADVRFLVLVRCILHWVLRSTPSTALAQ